MIIPVEEQMKVLGYTYTSIVGLPITWFHRDLYFNGHNVSKGYSDLACVPSAFHNAAHLVGVDIPPTELRQMANAQRGYTAKKGMQALPFAIAFDTIRHDLEIVPLVGSKDGPVTLDKAVALLKLSGCDSGVFCITGTFVGHAMAIQCREGSPVVIVDNNGFRDRWESWRGDAIHTVIGLKFTEAANV